MTGAKEKFVQCFPRMGTENFHKDIDADTLIDKSVNGGSNAEIIVKAVGFYAKSIGNDDEFYKIFDIDKDKPIREEDLKDNRQVVQMGILLQALEESKNGPVVLTIDELDKARPEVDAFKGEGIGTGDKQDAEKEKKDFESKDTSKGSSTKKDSKKSKDSEKKGEEKQERDYFITTNGTNPSKSKPKTTPEDLQKAVEKLFEEKKKKQEDFKNQNRQEY